MPAFMSYNYTALKTFIVMFVTGFNFHVNFKHVNTYGLTQGR